MKDGEFPWKSAFLGDFRNIKFTSKQEQTHRVPWNRFESSGFISLTQLSWSKSLWRSSGQGSVVLLTAISNSLLYNSLWDPNKRIGSALLRQVRLHFSGGITAFHFLSLKRLSQVPHEHNDALSFLFYDLSHEQRADSQLSRSNTNGCVCIFQTWSVLIRLQAKKKKLRKLFL